MNRRNFIRTGITAGALVPAFGVTPAAVRESRQGQAVSTVKDFDILGMKGRVTLETDTALPSGTTFSVDITPFDTKKALARIRMKPDTRLTIRLLSIQVSVPNADVNRIWYTQQLDGLGWHAYISLPWRATIEASGHFGCLLTALQDRYGQNRGLLALKNQSGDGSLHFSVEYGGPAMTMTINRFVYGGVWHAEEIDETAYFDLEDVPWNRAVDIFQFLFLSFCPTPNLLRH